MDDLLKDSTPEEREALFDSLNEDLLQVFDEDTVNLDSEFKFPLSHEAGSDDVDQCSFRMIEEVGRGGLKVVYKCEDKESGNLLAVATMKQEGGAREVERFLKEAKITGLLKHENIIEIFDCGISAEHGPYIAMDYLEGVTLAGVLAEISQGNKDCLKDYPLSRRLVIFSAVASAIEYAHSQGIVHLDLKPENIMLTNDGRVLVCDWGLARILPKFNTVENFALTSHSGVFVKGSPGYMAPEQIVHKEKTFVTDVYQLGGLLYAILFYRSPVEGQDIDEVLAKTVAGNLDLPDAGSNSLSRLMNQALEIDPDDRFESVSEMMESFQAIKESFAALEEKQRQADLHRHEAIRHQRHVTKRKKQVLLIASAVCVMLIVVIYFIISNSNQAKEAAQSEGKEQVLPLVDEEIDAESSYYKVLKNQ